MILVLSFFRASARMTNVRKDCKRASAVACLTCIWEVNC